VRAILKFCLLLLTSLSALAADTHYYYVDPDFSGTRTGSASQPWQSLGDSGAWTAINAGLASSNVTIYFSARAVGADTNQLTTEQLSILRTDQGANTLTFLGNSKWNQNDTTPSWTDYSGDSHFWIHDDYAINTSNTGSPYTNRVNLVVRGFFFQSVGGQIAGMYGTSNVLFEANWLTRDCCLTTGPGLHFAVPYQENDGTIGGIHPVDITIRSNRIWDTYGEGIYIGGSTPDPPGVAGSHPTGSNIFIYYNWITNAGTRGGQGDFIDVKDGNINLWISNNVLIGTSAGTDSDNSGIIAESGSGILNNYIVGHEGMGANGISVAGSWDNNIGRTNLLVANNVIVTPQRNGIRNVGVTSTNYQWTNVLFYNNTIYFPSNGSGLNLSAFIGPVEVKNNIFFGASPFEMPYDAATGLTVVHSNNLFWNPNDATRFARGEGNFWAFSDILTFEPSGQRTNPQLSSLTLLTVSNTSPAVNAGATLTQLPRDFLGVARPQGAAWDIGAYENVTGALTTNAIFAITNPLPLTQMVQVVRFTLATNAYTATNTALFNDAGEFVPWQQGSSNQIFFRAGLLPNSTNRYYFVENIAPTNINGVRGYLGLATNASASVPWQYQVTNGLHTGFRIVNPTVASYSNAAPIQGFQLRNAFWVNGELGTNGTNIHYVAKDDVDTAPVSVCWSNMTVTVVDAGPIYTELLFEGTYRKSVYNYLGSIEQWPAGPAFYKTRLMMSAHEPAVIVENFNNDAGYFRFDLSPGMAADEYRYRGHSASSDDYGVLFGFGGDYNDAPYHFDLITTIPFGSTNLVSQQRDELGRTAGVMAAAYNFSIFIRDAGMWNLMCDTNSTATSPTLGFANIRQSSGLGGVSSANSPRLGAWSTNTGKFGIEFGTQVYATTTTPMALPNARARWMIYMGTNGSVINSDTQPGYIQPEIMPLWARHYATDIDKIKAWNLGWTENLTPGGFYMHKDSVLTNYATPIKAGNTTLYDELKAASSSEGDLILDLWRTNSASAATSILSRLVYTAEQSFNLYTNWLTGDAQQANRFNSLQGGQLLGRAAPVLDAILGDGNATATISNQVKAWIALNGSFVRDNDFTPIDNYVSNAVNLGTANMGPQYTSFRGAYSLGFTNHPVFGTNVFADYLASSNTLTTIINAYGATIGSPHYAGASVQPIYANLLQARVRGWTNALYGRLQLHADWNIQSSTPIDPRFGQTELVVFGNGYPSANGFNGMLAGGFYDGVDSALASKLLYRWNQEGKPLSDYFFPSFLMVPYNYASANYTLRSSQTQGYWTAHRARADTTNHSAFWLINGSYYSDHRIQPDTGNYNWFPLSVPASVQWGSIYYPEIESQLFGQILVQADQFPSWNGSNVYTEALTFVEPQGEQATFVPFSRATQSDAVYTNSGPTTWTRNARTFDYFQNMSVLELQDTKNNSSNYISTYMLMSTGLVVHPAGGATPVFITNDVSGTRNMPLVAALSGSVDIPLTAGTNRWNYIGVTLTNALSNGLNFVLMTHSPTTNQATLATWSHSYADTAALADYQANVGMRFFEQQQIQRIKGTNNPHAVQLAYRKGTQEPMITTNGLGGWSISQGTEYQNIYTNHTEYSRSNNQANALAVWTGTNAVTGTNGLIISGGPAEIVIEGTNAVDISLSGATGMRFITLPSYATNRYRQLRPVASGRNSVMTAR